MKQYWAPAACLMVAPMLTPMAAQGLRFGLWPALLALVALTILAGLGSWLAGRQIALHRPLWRATRANLLGVAAISMLHYALEYAEADQGIAASVLDMILTLTLLGCLSLGLGLHRRQPFPS